jgi:hypothetical protein
MSAPADQIFERLAAQFPNIHVRRLPIIVPADFENAWLIALPDRGTQVQLKSANGNGPFLIEVEPGAHGFRAPHPAQAAAIIRALLI